MGKTETCRIVAFAILPALLSAQDDSAEVYFQRFQQLLNTKVISASQVLQDPMRAPAKVVIVTAREIRNRGYLDLEEVLHDLAGFDFEKGMGVHWSQIYMRGERSTNSDRFLFIWDGIIQNDIWKQAAWLERQYPLTSIERIEVMYGPASLLYGTNALSGIINVILRKEGDMEGLGLQVRTGPYRTRIAELHFGQARGDWRWMATARFHSSEDRDLTQEAWTDNGGRPRTYGLRPESFDRTALAQNVATDRAGVTHREYEPTTGQFWFRKNGLWQPFDGRFGVPALNTFFQAGLGYGGFSLKAVAWSREESQDAWIIPEDFLQTSWIATGRALRLSYDGPSWGSWTALTYLQMRTSGLDPESSQPTFTKVPQPANAAFPFLITRFGAYKFYKQFSREYRGGQRMTYVGPALQGLVEAEFIATQLREDYSTRTTDAEPWNLAPLHNDRNLSLHTSWQAEVHPKLALSGGLRLDHNWEAAGNGGFGNLYTGRAALIFTPQPAHGFRLLYGQAFQAPPASQKYSTLPSRPNPSPNLHPERLGSAELTYTFKPNERFHSSLTVYRNHVGNKIELVPLGQGLNRFENRGELNIKGLELESRFFLGPDHSFFLNLTAAEAQAADNGRDTGGIAPLQGNAGWEVRLSEGWGWSLRAHCVAARKTARWDSPDMRTVGTVAPYATMDLSLTWQPRARGPFANLTLSNLTNTRYYDPGVRSADGTHYNAAILQLPFRAFFGVGYRL